MKTVIRGNEAAALGAKLCRPQVIPAYPITPSTQFLERISEYVANGELDAEFMLVESEHSAMSACIGASAAGARVCTASASQGLALMHEMLFIASGMRLPIVMAIGNRALSAPINIWCDHQDTISERDSGWLQFYAERTQDALDLMIMAFKIAEDERVLLPAIVAFDGFVLTHTMEQVDVPTQAEVDAFLPPQKTTNSFVLEPSRPATFGSLATPDYYMEFKYAQEQGMHAAHTVIDEVFDEFNSKFNRRYQKITPYRTEDADIILLTMGSMSGTAKAAVDKLRTDGKKVGLTKLTVHRPFPAREVIALTSNAKVLAVIERNISIGFGGAVFGEVAGVFVNQRERPLIANYIVGLGGRDITIRDFETIVKKGEAIIDKGAVDIPTDWIGLH